MARAGERILDAGDELPLVAMDTVAHEEKARETVSELDLSFPVGHGLPLKETAATLGAFYEERRGILQATGFVVKPDGTIAVSQYSPGPIGRLVWQDVLGFVQHVKRLP